MLAFALEAVGGEVDENEWKTLFYLTKLHRSRLQKTVFLPLPVCWGHCRLTQTIPCPTSPQPDIHHFNIPRPAQPPSASTAPALPPPQQTGIARPTHTQGEGDCWQDKNQERSDWCCESVRVGRRKLRTLITVLEGMKKKWIEVKWREGRGRKGFDKGRRER